MIKESHVSQPISRPLVEASLTVPASASHQERRAVISRRRLLLMFVDALLLVGSWYFSHRILLKQGSPLPILSVGASALIWQTILYLKGFYNLKQVLPFHQRAYELCMVFGASVLATSAAYYLFPPLSVSLSVTWPTALLSVVSLLVWRTIYHRALPLPNESKRVLIVGAGHSGKHIALEIANHPSIGYEVVGFIDDAVEKSQDTIAGHPVLGNGERLPALVQTQKIDAIILAITHAIQDGMLKSLGDCVENGCKIINASVLTEQLSERVPVHHITHAWFINQLDESGRRHYELAKRALDIALAFIGLTVTGLLFPIIAVLIKLDSPGPVLYSQIRVGRKGRTFRIYKFRTMVQDAEAQGAVWAKKNDNRVTKLGDMLRKTRLDELPQLYNVLLGDMSMVGPRPERPEFVQTLAQSVPFFNRRHMVLPGLTGWAQVNYPYGASVEDSLEKLQYDLYYIKNRSMFLDIEIILKTIGVVIKKQGAR